MLSVPLAQSSVADLHDLTLYSNSNPMPAESALNILYQVALFWLQDDSRSHSFLAKTREIRYSPTEGNGSNILNALYGSLLSLFLKKRAEWQLLIDAEGSGNKFLRSNEAVVLKSLNMWFSCHVQDEVRLGPTWAAHLPAPRDQGLPLAFLSVCGHSALRAGAKGLQGAGEPAGMESCHSSHTERWGLKKISRATNNRVGFKWKISNFLKRIPPHVRSCLLFGRELITIQLSHTNMYTSSEMWPILKGRKKVRKKDDAVFLAPDSRNQLWKQSLSILLYWWLKTKQEESS